MRAFLLTIMAFFALCCNGQNAEQKMSLSGEWANGEGQKLYLMLKGMVVDSTEIKNGKFEFNSDSLVMDEYVLVRIGKSGVAEQMSIYMDNYPTYVKLSDSTMRANGMLYMVGEISGNPTASAARDVELCAFSCDAFRDKEFVEKALPVVERGDMAAAYVLRKFGYAFGNQLDYEALKKMCDGLSDSVRQTIIGKDVQEMFAIILRMAMGTKAPDFTLNTPEGDSVTLSEFVKGKKLVLLDFWASWCKPCREESKVVKAIYEKYHDKGLEILGISLDSELNEWKQAIAEDGYQWTQVSELKGNKSFVVELYDIMFIPYFMLLDGDGVIVGKNLRGETLEQKIEELLLK